MNEGRAGIVYVCGEWEHGQLGLPMTQLDKSVQSGSSIPSSGPRLMGRRELPSIPAVDQEGLVSELCAIPKLRKQKVAFIAAGGDHSFAISSTGRVFAFGKNDTYQLGVTVGGHIYNSASARLGIGNIVQEGADDRCSGPEPVQIVGLRWKQVVEIACGDCHSLARSRDGSVFAWGMGAGGRLGLGHHRTVQHPTKISSLSQEKCIQIGAGFYHSLALMEDGKLYAWGSGDGGQLGTGLAESSPLPRITNAPPEVSRWVRISAGEYHSAAVTESGALFTWGMNTFGQLGHGDLERRPSPTRITALLGVKIQLLSCGQAFNFIVTSSTEVYSWGQNDVGQLGHGDKDERRVPEVVVSFRGVHITALSCGGRHAAALDKDGRLWTWGENMGGCLGHGDGEYRPKPTCVQNSQDLCLEKVACGYGHMIAASGLDLAEVQSRDFFLDGLIHYSEPLENGFCLYTGSMSAQYRPLSVATAFFARHGVALSPDPIFVVDVRADARLREVVARVQALALRGPTLLERVRLAAVAVYYELGGAQARLNAASERHVSALIERAALGSNVVPLGSVRIGDARHRAALMKLVCDGLGVECCLVRGAVPDVDSSAGFFDLGLCGGGPDYAAFHVWNLVKLERDECFLVDCVGLPAELRRVDNSAALLEQLGAADRDVP